MIVRNARLCCSELEGCCTVSMIIPVSMIIWVFGLLRTDADDGFEVLLIELSRSEHGRRFRAIMCPAHLQVCVGDVHTNLSTGKRGFPRC